jgi:hypothetical protein
MSSVVCSCLSAAPPINLVQSFKNAGISLVKEGPAILCTVTPRTAQCLIAFEEVVTVRPTAEEAEDETEGDEDIEILMDEYE